MSPRIPLIACAALAAVAPAAPASRTERVGTSVEGRAINAVVLGPAAAEANVLVVGSVHGNETAGHAVVAALRRRGAHPPGVALWTVMSFNPDGVARGTRQNAHGVDLNRQQPFAWRPLPRGTYFSGPRPLSEPESRAINRLVKRLRPDVAVWYHQALEIVGGRGPVARAYARAVGLPAGRIKGDYPGSITRWQEHRFPETSPLVVEVAAGALSRADVRRHVRAVAGAGMMVAP